MGHLAHMHTLRVPSPLLLWTWIMKSQCWDCDCGWIVVWFITMPYMKIKLCFIHPNDRSLMIIILMGRVLMNSCFNHLLWVCCIVVSDKVALVIGNQQYQCDKLKGLFYSEKDAYDVAQALYTLGFKVRTKSHTCTCSLLRKGANIKLFKSDINIIVNWPSCPALFI